MSDLDLYGGRRQEFLALVVERGERIKRKRRAAIAGVTIGTAVVLVVFVVAVLAPLPGDDIAVAPAASTQVTDAPSPSPTPLPVSEPDETAAPTDAAPTRKPCADGSSERCDAADPSPSEPREGELFVGVKFTPEQPQAGETVTFYVVARDREGRETYLAAGDFGDGTKVASECERRPDPRYTPLIPTASEKDEDRRFDSFSHTYTDAASYEVSFTYSTQECGRSSDSTGEATGTGTARVVVG